jgi:hypothetical protein
LAGTDEAGAVGNASVTVNVADPATSRTPVVSILSPKPDQELKPELLTSVYGVAVAKSPATYTLVLKYGSTETTLATGAPGLWSGSPNGVAVSRLWRPGDSFPFTCGGWLVQIILRVTDADGKTGSASVHVSIPYPVC